MLKICQNCKIEFKSPRKSIKYCSTLCYSSFPKSQDTKEKISKSNKKPKPAGFGEKVSNGTKNKPKPWIKGEKNPNYGKKLKDNPEIYNKFRDAVKKRGQVWTDEHKKAHSDLMKTDVNWMKGKEHSIETKLKIKKIKDYQYKNGLVKFGGHKISKPEKEISEHFNNFNIEHKQQYHIKGLPYTYDFFILNTNIIIEFQGDYWHCNPLKYKSGQYVKFQRIGERLVDDVWARDKTKKDLAEELGYIVIQIWQNDYNKYGINFIIDKLKENGWKNI